MADYEVVNASSGVEIDNPSSSDTFVAFNNSTSALEQIRYDNVARGVVQNYSSSTLAGKKQSVKDAFDGLKANIDDLTAKTDKVGNGTPIAVKTAAEMTDTKLLYLYTGTETGYSSGHWYYYDGTKWADGGPYGNAELDTTLTKKGAAADAKAVGDALKSIPTSARVEGTCLYL